MGDSFEGKVVVVTGASTGVGRAIARAFGEEKAKVALIARTEEALNHAAEEISRAGGEAFALPVDVSDAQALEAAADRVINRWGKIDIWVNDAMVTVYAEIRDLSFDEMKRVTEVTYLGAVYGTQIALRHMQKRDDGVIIQIGSALAYRSIPLQGAYCGAKAAMRGFTDSLRCELIHQKSKVKISMLQLPAVNTPQFDQDRNKLESHPQPVPPIFQPEVIARAALFAAKRKPRELWIARSTWKAILGQKVIPGLLDWYLGKGAYKSQKTHKAPPPRGPGNLFAPVPGDRGAHGIFDQEATSRSALLWARIHARELGVGAALAASIAGFAGFRALRA